MTPPPGPAPRDQPRRAGPGRAGQPPRLRPRTGTGPRPARLHPPRQPRRLDRHHSTRPPTPSCAPTRSADEPTGRLLTACGNRRSSRCPACSRLYAADTYHLIKAGLSGGKNVAEPSATTPAPSSPSPPPPSAPSTTAAPPSGQAPGPARCGERHADDAPELGTPLNPATYDYTGAVLWNAHAGALWARFTTYLRRALADHLGMTQKALNAALRVSFAKVAEYQQRGLVHFHAVIRFDGPDGHTTSPPAWATFDALPRAVGLAVERARAHRRVRRGRRTRHRLGRALQRRRDHRPG